MASEFPKVYTVQGDTLIVDEDLHRTLNLLARRFYQLQGYRSQEDFDFSTSVHPQESLMYLMALEAAYLQRQSGELDG